jgi:hypothetical protein
VILLLRLSVSVTFTRSLAPATLCRTERNKKPNRLTAVSGSAFVFYFQRQRKCQCVRHTEGVDGRERASRVLPDPGWPDIFMFWTKTSHFQLCRPPDPAALGRKRGKKVCAISSCNTATLQHPRHERSLRLGIGAFRVISSFALSTSEQGFRRACCCRELIRSG